jgi:biopolymer transport protein ExbD
MLLLIFFLLTSQFIVTTGVQVRLPKSETAESLTETQLNVTITKTNDIYFGSEKISLGMLGEKLLRSKSTEKENNLIIRTDRDVSIEIIIKVIDISKGVGVSRFTIATEKEML